MSAPFKTRAGVLSSAGSGDAGKVPLLNAQGRLDISFVPAVLALLAHPGALPVAADDAAAAAAGVNVGEFYRAGSAIMVRIT